MSEGIVPPLVQQAEKEFDPGQSGEEASATSPFQDLILTTLEVRLYAAPYGKKKGKWMEVIRSLNS